MSYVITAAAIPAIPVSGDVDGFGELSIRIV